MKKKLFLLVLSIVIFNLTQIAFAAGAVRESTIIQGNVSYIPEVSELMVDGMPTDRVIILGQKELALVGANKDIFGKGYSFVMRGSYNGWEYGGEESWKNISEKDVRIVEKDEKLFIKVQDIDDAAKAVSNKLSWDDTVTILVFDKAGEYVNNLMEDVPLYKFDRRNFKPISNAKVTVISTQETVITKSNGDFQIKARKGKIGLQISADGFTSQIVYVNTGYEKQLFKAFLLNKNKLTFGSRYRYCEFYSEELKNAREVIVYLPESYMKDKKKRYPVLYMHDGQNIFDESTSAFGEEWKVDEAINNLVSQGKMKEIIVVGIYNTNHRTEEYADYLRSQYADLVATEIKPTIDARFRTLPQRENTAIMGSSFGALISLYTAYKYPNVFGMIGSISTAPYNGDIFDTIQKKGNLHFKKIWVDTGTAEDETGNYVLNARLLKTLFEEQGYRIGNNFGYYEDEGAIHNEVCWSKRVWMPLTLFFGK